MSAKVEPVIPPAIAGPSALVVAGLLAYFVSFPLTNHFLFSHLLADANAGRMPAEGTLLTYVIGIVYIIVLPFVPTGILLLGADKAVRAIRRRRARA